MNKELINQTSIKWGEAITKLQELQRFYDDSAIQKLLYPIAQYQQKLVTASCELAVTKEQVKRAA